MIAKRNMCLSSSLPTKSPLRGCADKEWVMFEDIYFSHSFTSWKGEGQDAMMGSGGKGSRRINHPFLWLTGRTRQFTKARGFSPALKHLHPQSFTPVHIYHSQGVACSRTKISGLRILALGHLSESLYTLERDVFTVATESSWRGCKLIPDFIRMQFSFIFVKKIAYA